MNAGLNAFFLGRDGKPYPLFPELQAEIQTLASHFIQRADGRMWYLFDRSSGQLIATSLEPFPEVAKISPVEADADDGRSHDTAESGNRPHGRGIRA